MNYPAQVVTRIRDRTVGRKYNELGFRQAEQYPLGS
jgi:hypothetical protein